MPGTCCLGVDIETASPASEVYSRLGLKMLEREDIRATWYVTGRSMEMYPEAFRRADESDRVDIQAHTYAHLRLKTVWMRVPAGREYAGRRDHLVELGGSNEQIDADLARCQQVFIDALGRSAVGLTGPWGYYRGLGDRPDLLEIVHRHGFRILRTFARNETDGEPIPLEWAPFFYEPQGYPDMLEIMVHGYQDDYTFRSLTGLERAEDYVAYLRGLADRVAAEDLCWGLCSHDHDCHDEEGFAAKTAWIWEAVRYARSIGIRFVTATELYHEALARREDAASP